jgi:hypothetical protein
MLNNMTIAALSDEDVEIDEKREETYWLLRDSWS